MNAIPEVVKSEYFYDNSEDKLIIKREQDVEPILDDCYVKRTNNSRNWKGDLHHVGSIPMVIIEKYKNEKGIDLLADVEALKKFLNDPDNKMFRTKLGRV